nr:integrase, catalytic region, zinc finger, CCHC-type, peptidase aspartic, catalytic [Tanacetum cinerariifolium]
MSNTNNSMQTQTSNALHNAIMEAGGKDRPPMLAPGNYVQWKSRIKRYIDTKPNHELIHYCLKNPLYKFTWADKTVPVFEGSSETTNETYMENYKNVSQDIRDQLNTKAEAVQIILTGIDNDIYSTVDACPNACEMWKAIERLKQEWQRVVTLVKQSQEIKTVSYHKLYDILKQHQNEVNEIRAERIAHDEMSKDKEIDKLMALISLSFKKIYKPTNNNLRTSLNTSRVNQDNYPRINRGTRYESQRIGNVVGAMETVGTMVVQQSGIQCYNCKEFGHVARECQKLKRVKDAAYHKEKMLLCKQEEARIQLNAEQADWRDDTDEESEDHELKAHYMYMEHIQEVNPDAAGDSGPIFDDEPMQKVSNNDNYNVFTMESEHPEQSKSVRDTYHVEQDEHNVVIDSLDMSYDREQIHQDDDDDADLANERELLVPLIEKLKCEIDDNKNRNKILETSNKVLVEKLKGEIEDFKNKNKSLESSNNRFKEANNELTMTNELMYKDLKKFQAELDRRNDVKNASKMEIDCAKAKGDLISYKIESQNSFNAYTQKINDLNQTISEMKKELSAHQETISILSQAKEAQIKLYKTREDKELDKVIALENKVKVLDNIIYKTGQSVQTMNMLNSKCRTSFAKPEFLKKAQRANPRLYDIGCYNDNLALMLAPDSDEVIRLEKENEVTNLHCDYLETLDKCECLEKELSKRMYKLHTKPTQTRTSQLPHDFRKTNKRVSFSTRLIPTTSVSRPQLKRNPMEDRVMRNNSQGKKQEVEDQRRNVKFSKNKTYVTACNDSLKAKTSNVNFVCATCEKCVLNEKNDMCVLKSRNDVHSRTKMPIAVPVSTREPKHTVKQSVAKPLRKTVASESTNQKPRNITKKLYEKVSKTCSWWYPKFTPPGYNWKPKSEIGNVNQNKFLGMVNFGNDQIVPNLGYGDLVQGAVTIKRVYYVEGLNHNLFSIGQFCDADLEVAFRKSTCYIRDLKGNDLLT